MAHLSENSKRLSVTQIPIRDRDTLLKEVRGCADVCLVRLPSAQPTGYRHRLQGLNELFTGIANALSLDATLITLGEIIDLVEVHSAVTPNLRFQHWMAIKRDSPIVVAESTSLPQHHFGALIHTGYRESLRHTKTRIKYTYCPACDKTTKDYGGKKHTYHRYGTLMSDVWRDVSCSFDSDLTLVTERFADLFGVEPYRELRVLDLRPLGLKRVPVTPDKKVSETQKIQHLPEQSTNKLFNEDCLDQLRKFPDNSVDFAFADPPYNLGKDYLNYSDDRGITEYFEWCDEWITELARVLRPGRTCAILNIPLWAIRHFQYMEQILQFQNWIAWDALAFPVRFIMPAHYTILAFSKGDPRPLPGLNGDAGKIGISTSPDIFETLNPLGENFCRRSRCLKERRKSKINDRGPLTDLWWDIHRLKHNSRRVDHPTQLPPQLMYRLIALFTKPGEIVLDCFNGAGTTTLAAHQLHRKYVGVEISEKYHNLAVERHEEICKGIDPFRKRGGHRSLVSKNSPVPRMPKREYEVSKKTLQLEVRRVAQKLGRLPNRDELIKHGKYPIKYYDEYFVSWGEVCAAARTTGMTETRDPEQTPDLSIRQLDFSDLGTTTDEKHLGSFA